MKTLVNVHCALGEGPLWHPDEQQLYWIDIEAGNVFRLQSKTGEVHATSIGRKVGGFTFQRGGGLLLFLDQGAVGSLRGDTFREVIKGAFPLTRFNDVIADPKGRIYCGLMPTASESGMLCRLDTDGQLHILADGFMCPNGMTFNRENNQMYFIDSGPRCIYVFDYESASGALYNRRIYIILQEADGLPDGMTIDASGDLWVGCWDGHQIIRIRSAKVVERIRCPTAKITSLTFGGRSMDRLFITSAGGSLQSLDHDCAGAIFEHRPNVKGPAPYFSAINV